MRISNLELKTLHSRSPLTSSFDVTNANQKRDVNIRRIKTIRCYSNVAHFRIRYVPAIGKAVRSRVTTTRLDGHVINGTTPTSKRHSTAVTEIKVNSYTVNKERNIKKALSKIEQDSEIVKKDGGGQYVITLCPPTYHVIVSRMVDSNNVWGIKIEGAQVDNEGTSISGRFIAVIPMKREEGQIKIAVTCYDTTSNIQLQLKGNRKGSQWREKIAEFGEFVGSIADVVKKIEESDGYVPLKMNIQKDLVIELKKTCHKETDTVDESTTTENGKLINVVVAKEDVGADTTKEDATTENDPKPLRRTERQIKRTIIVKEEEKKEEKTKKSETKKKGKKEEEQGSKDMNKKLCTCQKTFEEDGDQMIDCSGGCKNWFHIKCIKYKCDQCIAKNADEDEVEYYKNLL